MKLPAHKSDLAAAEAIVAAGYPAVDGVLFELLEWIKDMNWPVASVIAPFLVDIGLPLAPHARRVLAGSDDVWKYWLIDSVLARSPALAETLGYELVRIAERPTNGEVKEEVDLVARDALCVVTLTTHIRKELGSADLARFRAHVQKFLMMGGERQQARRAVDQMRKELPAHEDRLLEILDVITGWE